MSKKPRNPIVRLVVNFALGVGFALAFLVSFQIFRQANWIVGGFMVMMLFGGLFVTLSPSNVKPPILIHRASLTRALAEILASAKVDDTGKIEVDPNEIYKLLGKHSIGFEEIVNENE